jgi:L-cysteine:1D-myo-inositol 2-amino-2-deoxy-alpha-D-glucopyranoside ligase
VRHWLQVGLVGLDGTKMSKSLGNLVFVSDLLKGWEPAVVRLALLDHHYRPDWEWTGEDLPRAARRLDGWRAAPRPEDQPDPTSSQSRGDGDVEAGDQSSQIVGWYLDDDLDTPGALAALDSMTLSGIPVAGGASLLGITL